MFWNRRPRRRHAFNTPVGNSQDISSRLLLPGGMATISTNGNNVTFASSFGGGSGSLVKTGSGAIALDTAANTFTGNTTINGGTLQLNVQGNGGSPGYHVADGYRQPRRYPLCLNIVDALAYIPGAWRR